MNRSIKADVAMNTLFSNLNAAITSPRIAPPVPSNPAENPETEPPIQECFAVGGITNVFLTKNSKLKPIRKKARITASHCASRYFVR